MFAKKVWAGAALVMAMAAPAAALEVSTQGSHAFKDASGGNQWYTRTAFQVGSQTIDPVYAGLFRLKYTEDAGATFTNFLAFCLQPLETLTLPKTHTETTTLAQSVLDDLNALASNVWGSIDLDLGLASSADKSAARKAAIAMQMAVWEIANETGSYDIDDGFFKITGTTTGSNTAEAMAQGYLDNISNGTWTAGAQGFRIFSADGTQDLLTNLQEPDDFTPPPVPLPATGLLLIAGLGALGWRKARAGV